MVPLLVAIGVVLLAIFIAWVWFAYVDSGGSASIGISVERPKETQKPLYGYNPLGVLPGATFLIDHPMFNKGAYRTVEVRRFKRNLATAGRFTDYVVTEDSPSPTQAPFIVRFFEHPVPGVESDGRVLELLYSAPHTKQHKDALYNAVRDPGQDVLSLTVRGQEALFRRQGPAAGYEVSTDTGVTSTLFGRLWTFNAEFPADAADKRDETVYVMADKDEELLTVHVGDFLEKFRFTILNYGR